MHICTAYGIDHCRNGEDIRECFADIVNKIYDCHLGYEFEQVNADFNKIAAAHGIVDTPDTEADDA